jgi:hypothetical protein
MHHQSEGWQNGEDVDKLLSPSTSDECKSLDDRKFFGLFIHPFTGLFETVFWSGMKRG